jgi:hypothetical protein
MLPYTLIAKAQERWRNVNGAELSPLVRAGARFADGVERIPTNAVAEKNEDAA